MEAPSGSMLVEVDEILARDVKKLATARDVPRLARHLVLQSGNGATAFEGGGVLELLRTLRQLAGSAGPEVAECPEEGDTVRAYLAQLTGPERAVELFVMRCVNQNVIAPAVLRLKYDLSKAGFATKGTCASQGFCGLTRCCARCRVAHLRHY
jgi:hypothetical protein